MMFRIRLLTITVGLAVAGLFSVTAHAQQALPSARLLDRYGLEVLWSSQAVMHQNRDHVMNVEIDEESVYVQSQNGFVSAFDSQSGNRRWAQLVGRINSPQLPLTSNSDTVLVTSGVKLYAIDKWQGGELWRLSLQEQAGARPTADEERIYVATQHGSVFAYDLSKIYELYHSGRLPKWSKQTELWRHRTSRPIHTPPIRYDDQLTFASQTNIIYSVRPKTDRLVFQMTTSSHVTAPMVQYGEYLFMCNDSQHVYCLDKALGTTVWDFISRSKVTQKPRFVNNRCYVSPVAGSLYCIDVNTGVEYWEAQESVKFVAVTDSYVAAEDELGNLLLLSPNSTETDVELTARLPFKGFKYKVSNDLTDRIYMVSDFGQVICLREKSNSFPKFFRNPDRRPIEPLFTDENAAAAEPTDDNQ
ncbi:MAG: PQQ-binding-like beta-propeller repeat protein [Planctomycetaceae bacterium]|nr:PQQ-binding-like beta-propeller repeat protein [Planctomycetaceae bacterium]